MQVPLQSGQERHFPSSGPRSRHRPGLTAQSGPRSLRACSESSELRSLETGADTLAVPARRRVCGRSRSFRMPCSEEIGRWPGGVCALNSERESVEEHQHSGTLPPDYCNPSVHFSTGIIPEFIRVMFCPEVASFGVANDSRQRAALPHCERNTLRPGWANDLFHTCIQKLCVFGSGDV